MIEAFESESDFEARMVTLGRVLGEDAGAMSSNGSAVGRQRQARAHALWERKTREDLIAAINRLAAALEIPHVG